MADANQPFPSRSAHGDFRMELRLVLAVSAQRIAAAGERNRGLETASAIGTSIAGDSPRLSRFLNRGSFLLWGRELLLKNDTIEDIGEREFGVDFWKQDDLIHAGVELFGKTAAGFPAQEEGGGSFGFDED